MAKQVSSPALARPARLARPLGKAALKLVWAGVEHQNAAPQARDINACTASVRGLGAKLLGSSLLRLEVWVPNPFGTRVLVGRSAAAAWIGGRRSNSYSRSLLLC